MNTDQLIHCLHFCVELDLGKHDFFSFLDQAFLHASCEDDDGKQVGSAQGQNSERSNRNGLQG